MGKDESELVPMNKEPGYGGTDADEESKKPDIDISDFKPAAPTWVLDGSLRAKEQKKFEALIESASSKAPGKMAGCLNATKPCLGWTLAAVGFYFQYTQMFSPPFIVELLLWPLQTIEYGLLYAVASTSAPAAA